MRKVYGLMARACGGLALALLVTAVLAAPARDASAGSLSQCPSAAGAGGKCAGCVNAGAQCTIGGNAGTCGVIASSQCCDCMKAGPVVVIDPVDPVGPIGGE